MAEKMVSLHLHDLLIKLRENATVTGRDAEDILRRVTQAEQALQAQQDEVNDVKLSLERELQANQEIRTLYNQLCSEVQSKKSEADAIIERENSLATKENAIHVLHSEAVDRHHQIRECFDEIKATKIQFTTTITALKTELDQAMRHEQSSALIAAGLKQSQESRTSHIEMATKQQETLATILAGLSRDEPFSASIVENARQVGESLASTFASVRQGEESLASEMQKAVRHHHALEENTRRQVDLHQKLIGNVESMSGRLQCMDTLLKGFVKAGNQLPQKPKGDAQSMSGHLQPMNISSLKSHVEQALASVLGSFQQTVESFVNTRDSLSSSIDRVEELVTAELPHKRRAVEGKANVFTLPAGALLRDKDFYEKFHVASERIREIVISGAYGLEVEALHLKLLPILTSDDDWARFKNFKDQGPDDGRWRCLDAVVNGDEDHSEFRCGCMSCWQVKRKEDARLSFRLQQDSNSS